MRWFIWPNAISKALYTYRKLLISSISPRNFWKLRNANILHSKKGKGGGYYLYKKPGDVNLIEIIRLMDGAIAMLPCVSLNYYEPCEECRDEKTCGIRDAFIGVRDETLRILSESTLEQILHRKAKVKK